MTWKVNGEKRKKYWCVRHEAKPGRLFTGCDLKPQSGIVERYNRSRMLGQRTSSLDTFTYANTSKHNKHGLWFIPTLSCLNNQGQCIFIRA